MAEMPSSLATSTAETLYSMGSPSKFDITVFPNASAINVQSVETEKKKILPPNPQLRPLENIPQQMVADEEEEDDVQINTIPSIVATPHNYTNPSKRDRVLRWISTVLAIVSALLLVFISFFISLYTMKCIKCT